MRQQNEIMIRTSFEPEHSRCQTLDLGSSTALNPQNMSGLQLSYSPSGFTGAASKMSQSEIADGESLRDINATGQLNIPHKENTNPQYEYFNIQGVNSLHRPVDETISSSD